MAAFLSFAKTAVGLARLTSHLDSPSFDRPLDIFAIGEGERPHFLEGSLLGFESLLTDPCPLPHCPFKRSKQNVLLQVDERILSAVFPQ